MDAILEPIGQFWEGFLSNPIVQLASQLIVIYVVLLWLGTAYWAFRDMQARTENPILPYFAAALIIFFTPLLFLFAVILYLIVRPRETLAEVYERSLAEESLLAEVEKNELCPVCRDRVEEPSMERRRLVAPAEDLLREITRARLQRDPETVMVRLAEMDTRDLPDDDFERLLLDQAGTASTRAARGC